MGAMSTLNGILFHWLGAGFAPEPHLLAAARWLAIYPIAGVPIILVLLWWRRPGSRETLLTAMASGGLALAATEVIAAALALPRPFVLGLSPVYLAHSAEGSFPSAHASLMLATAGTLLLSRATLPWGAGLTVLALATAWARVYLGLHFPLDILGSILLASAMVAALGSRARGLRWLGRSGGGNRTGSGDNGNSIPRAV
jgi:undecaprenyl-diphosphatase